MTQPATNAEGYRGRLAPSPTGYLHLGHAQTFWIAQQRAEQHGGALILRNEDLDPDRSKATFAEAMLEDLRWFGLQWQEGPDCGGPYGPYHQSERRELYAAALVKLHAGGWVYPCTCSRKELQRASQAPHQGEEEPVYPGTCRPQAGTPLTDQAAIHSALDTTLAGSADLATRAIMGERPRINWRFRVPDGEVIRFGDGCQGPQAFAAGKDFGDFVVWRHDGVPAYQLAVVVDDAAMRITEVVRGADLLLSTARQLLLYQALRLLPPRFFHCPLVTDDNGVRLAKRHDALSLRHLRQQGVSPEEARNRGHRSALATP